MYLYIYKRIEIYIAGVDFVTNKKTMFTNNGNKVLTYPGADLREMSNGDDTMGRPWPPQMSSHYSYTGAAIDVTYPGAG